jgi:3-mercaptopropionate dioxygenase
VTAALTALVDAVRRALDDLRLASDRGRVDAMRPAMAALLADPDGVPEEACRSLNGDAVGNLLYAAPDGRFHVLAVVFPEGTSSGVHHHGCWGLIGYLRGGDEETRYRCLSESGDRADLEEASRHVWHQGDITELLPPDEGWHRVRNPGPGTGVSIHVLCLTPPEHPHRFWDRSTGAVLPYPFIEVAPDRWQTQVEWPEAKEEQQ